MGCKKDNGKDCVCDAVEAILDAQEAVVDCPTSCFSNLLAPTTLPGKDTIPFILYTKEGKPFKAFGNVGGLNNGLVCFDTFYFRVESLRDCCATLSLLRPVDVEGDTVCVTDPCGGEDFFGLEKTDFCIEVDLDCFCAIQCLSPLLVDRVFEGVTKKRRHHE